MPFIRYLVGLFFLLGLVVRPVSAEVAPAGGNAAVQSALALGDYEAALNAVERRLKQTPQDPELLFIKALTLTMLERLNDASAIFYSLAREYPQLPEPANNLAVIQARLGDFLAAQRTLQELLQRHPGYAAAHENLGDVLTAQAETAYRRAAELGEADATLRGKLDILQSLNALPYTRKNSDLAPPPATPALVLPTAQSGRADVQGRGAQQEQRAVVEAALEAWRASWAAGDVQAYLAAYSQEFVPPRGLERSEWIAQRRARVSPQRQADIRLTGVEMAFRDPGLVTVTVNQEYRSARFSDNVVKRIQLRRESGGWKILREYIPQ